MASSIARVEVSLEARSRFSGMGSGESLAAGPIDRREFRAREIATRRGTESRSRLDLRLLTCLLFSSGISLGAMYTSPAHASIISLRDPAFHLRVRTRRGQALVNRTRFATVALAMIHDRCAKARRAYELCDSVCPRVLAGIVDYPAVRGRKNAAARMRRGEEEFQSVCGLD
jgi:hypothetical protein